MMTPQQTLAQKVKAKYPGVYDDLADADLEAKVKAKYPGVYDDLPMTGATPAAPKGAGIRALESGLRAAWNQIAPLIPGTEASKDVGQAIRSGEFLKAIPREMMLQAVDAEVTRQSGDYVTAGRKLLLSALPIVGPMVSRRMDQAQAGELAESLGGVVGDLVGLVATGGASTAVARGAMATPRMVARGVSNLAPTRVAGRLGNLNTTEAAAVRYGVEQGVPLDVATATGSRAVRKLQETSDSTLANTIARTGEQAKVQTSAGMTDLGRRLAGKANERPGGQPGAAMTPETAGQAAQGRATSVIADEYRKANEAYGTLHEIEARPEHQVQVAVRGEGKAAPALTVEAPVPDHFAPVGAGIDELFEGVYQDAKVRGYRGTKADLRRAFDEKAKTAYDDAADLDQTARAYEPKALFQAIRDAGGIGTDDVYSGEIARLWESSSGTVVQRGFTKAGGLKRSKTLPTGGFSGVTNVLRRTGGKSLDTIAQSLREDPRFAHIDGPNTLLDALDEAVSGLGNRAQTRQFGGVSPEDALYFQGVQPGARWWETAADQGAAGQQTVTLSLPVDMRPVKAALKPVRERWLQTMTQTQREASPGLLAVNNIVDGPDYVSASVADTNLSMLKGLSRGALTVQSRDVSQGLAAGAVKQLHKAVDEAVAKAGPDAVEALKAGRLAVKARVRAERVYKLLGGKPDATGVTEPTAAYKLATLPRDSNIARLREVARIAPEEVRNIGRAYLDGLIDKATKEGGFGKAKGLFNEWQQLGDKTKAVLFKDAKYIADLDKFFLLAKRLEDMANPSGSGHVATLAVTSAGFLSHPVSTALINLGSLKLSQFLHSPEAVRVIVRGWQAAPKSMTAEVSRRWLARQAVAPLALQGGRTTAPAGFQAEKRQ